MKTVHLMVMLLLLFSLGANAQVDQSKDMNYVVIYPKSYEHQFLNSILSKYQIDSDQKQLIIFCWGQQADGFSDNRIERRSGGNLQDERTELLTDIGKYQQEIRKLEGELEQLKAERMMILKKLSYMKSILDNGKKNGVNKVNKTETHANPKTVI